MSEQPIWFNRPAVTGREEQYIAEALASGHLAGDGAFTKRSREALESILGAARVLPAHGPELPDLAAVCRAYRRHRQERLSQVRDAVTAASLDPGDPAAVAVVTDRVYGEVDPAVRGAAESSVAAQLRYLAGGGR